MSLHHVPKHKWIFTANVNLNIQNESAIVDSD